MQNQKKTITIILIILAVTTVFFVYFLQTKQKSGSIFPERPEVAEEQNSESRQGSLNGSLQTDEALAAKRPLAVVVENYPTARPQSGLFKADLVFETVAEGGITRFLAVYQTQTVENIGPIRSARTYFAEIADELGAVFAHVGGNSDVLENLKQGTYPKILNADQFFLDKYFHRISARPMPHNVYSSTEKLYSYFLDTKKPTGEKYGKWLYTDKFSGPLPAGKVDVQFSTSDYAVSYVYNSELSAYERFMAGHAHLDADNNNQLFAKNVIVQSVRTWPVKTDTPFSISMDLAGGGSAYVFSQGRGILGTWKKNLGDRTRYYDGQGKEIEFARGITWVELVPEERIGELKWTSQETKN